MGLFSSKSIKFATANYSGITNSPFQFYSEDVKGELQKLNEIFKALFSQLGRAGGQLQNTLAKHTKYSQLKGVISEQFNWNIGSIDKSMHRGRYAAQYRKDVGIQNGRLITNQRYLQIWESEYNKNIKYVNKNINPEKKELALSSQKEVCKVYDFLIYKTFAEYCYMKVMKHQNIEEIVEHVTIEDREPSGTRQAVRSQRKQALLQYEALMDQFHDKPFLSHQLKFMKIKELYLSCDVVFLQDCSDELINQIKNEGDITIIEPFNSKGDCYILINSNRRPFQKLYDTRKILKSQEQIKRNEASIIDPLFTEEQFTYADSYPAVCFTDNFLLISLRFSSKAQKKNEQLDKFKQHLCAINQKYGNSLKIVVGGDFNMDISIMNQAKTQQQRKALKNEIWGTKKFFCYPFDNIYTTRKQRTWLQSQASKSIKLDQSQRDFLISNTPLLNWKLIHNSVGQKACLPTEKHPFDHFFISAQLPRA